MTCAFADVSGADVCRRREAGGVATRRSAPAAPVGRSTWAVRTAGAEQGPANASLRAPAPAPAEDSMSMSVISLPRSAMALQRMATNPVTQGDAHDGDAGPVVGVAGRTVSSLACAHALVCVQMDACVRCSERVFVYGVRGACAPSSHTHFPDVWRMCTHAGMRHTRMHTCTRCAVCCAQAGQLLCRRCRAGLRPGTDESPMCPPKTKVGSSMHTVVSVPQISPAVVMQAKRSDQHAWPACIPHLHLTHL